MMASNLSTACNTLVPRDSSRLSSDVGVKLERNFWL